MKTKVLFLFLWLSLAGNALAWDNLYANDGTYLGNTNPNQYDPNSINNPYGKYGNQYSTNSVNNPYGQYGSLYSSTSPNNPYTNPAVEIPQYSNYGYQVGGWSHRRY